MAFCTTSAASTRIVLMHLESIAGGRLERRILVWNPVQFGPDGPPLRHTTPGAILADTMPLSALALVRLLCKRPVPAMASQPPPSHRSPPPALPLPLSAVRIHEKLRHAGLHPMQASLDGRIAPPRVCIRPDEHRGGTSGARVGLAKRSRPDKQALASVDGLPVAARESAQQRVGRAGLDLGSQPPEGSLQHDLPPRAVAVCISAWERHEPYLTVTACEGERGPVQHADADALHIALAASLPSASASLK